MTGNYLPDVHPRARPGMASGWEGPSFTGLPATVDKETNVAVLEAGQFVPNFASLAAPLTELLRKDTPRCVCWTDKCR